MKASRVHNGHRKINGKIDVPANFVEASKIPTVNNLVLVNSIGRPPLLAKESYTSRHKDADNTVHIWDNIEMRDTAEALTLVAGGDVPLLCNNYKCPRLLLESFSNKNGVPSAHPHNVPV